jgi:hypothetical protein
MYGFKDEDKVVDIIHGNIADTLKGFNKNLHKSESAA